MHRNIKILLTCSILIHGGINTLLHGIDVTTILRTQMSTQEMVYGFVQIFILGWLMGASIASIYNFHPPTLGRKAKS